MRRGLLAFVTAPLLLWADGVLAQAAKQVHPMLREWTRDRAVGTDVTIPYHTTAVRFYRERGVWTPELEQAQQRLLAVNP